MLSMQVSLKLGHFALRTQLSVDHENFGLLGHSGAGKSTLLKLLAGTLIPESGHIILDGKTLYDSSRGIFVPREQRPIGAVLQADQAHVAATVSGSLHDVFQRTPKQRRCLKPKRLLEFLEIGHVMKQPEHMLSSGERQRVLLAKALLKSPRILLLDDPLATLGPMADSVLPFLKRIHAELQLPIFHASSNLGNVAELSEKVAVLDKGFVTGVGLLRDLLRDADLLQGIGVQQIQNKIPARIVAHDKELGCTHAESFGNLLTLPLLTSLPVGAQGSLTLAAQEVALAKQMLSGISIQNQIKGRVCALIPTGNAVLVQIDCGHIWLAVISLKACKEMRLQEGSNVYCLAKAQSFTFCRHLDHAVFTDLIANPKTM